MSPVTYPKRYRYISMSIDNYSRLAMAYPMKVTNETGECRKEIVKSARNVLNYDAHVCNLERFGFNEMHPQ